MLDIIIQNNIIINFIILQNSIKKKPLTSDIV